MTDNIARLREAWEKTTPGEWRPETVQWDEDGNPEYYYVEGIEYTGDGVDLDLPTAAFIAIAHNEFGKILDVLAAVDAWHSQIEEYRTLKMNVSMFDTDNVLIATLSVLKGDLT